MLKHQEEEQGEGYGQYQKLWARGRMEFGEGMGKIHESTELPDGLIEQMLWLVYTLEIEKEPQAEFLQQVLIQLPFLIVLRFPMVPEMVSELGGILMGVFKNWDEDLALQQLETYYNRYMEWSEYDNRSEPTANRLMMHIRNYVKHIKRKWKESL
nr:MAG TPA: hypothetical protein [Caudoviricetes sp.]